MPGGVDSVTDIIGGGNVEADVTRNVRTEPGSVENKLKMPADSSRPVNNEKDPPVTAEAGAGGGGKGADASADTAKELDQDADVSPAVTIYRAIRAEVKYPLSWPRSGEVPKPGLRKKTRSC
jgi:hypothetical protein